MSASLSYSPQLLTFSFRKTNPSFTFPKIHSFLHQNRKICLKTQSFPIFPTFSHLGRVQRVTRGSSDSFLEAIEEEEGFPETEEKPLKFLFWVLLWASVSVGLFAVSGDAKAAADSIRTSGFGVKVATALRSSGWPDEAVVFALATLPVIELRGAIPVGYWLQLKPTVLTVLSVLG